MLKAMKDLEEVPLWNFITLGIGVMGLMSIGLTSIFLLFRKEKLKVTPGMQPKPPLNRNQRIDKK